MRYVVAAMGAAACLASVGVAAERNLQEDYLNQFLRGIEEKRQAVFLSQCRSESPSYRAMLIVVVRSGRGVMVEYDGGQVRTVSDIETKPEGLTVAEASGGVYSYARIAKLVGKLSGYEFRLLVPFREAAISSLQIERKCLNADH